MTRGRDSGHRSGGEDGPGHLGVPPYNHWDLYGKASPITHVDSIKTPVLIIAGDMDYSAPMEQSEEFFTALNRTGKVVRYVRYPGAICTRARCLSTVEWRVLRVR